LFGAANDPGNNRDYDAGYYLTEEWYVLFFVVTAADV